MGEIKNSQGKVYYGIHFYPGVAQYQDAPDQSPYCVYLNEDTIRSMDPTFAGKPIFVEHVDEVEPKLDELRKEADGWVIKSFYNSSDGKHWVEFIITSERGLKAVDRGLRLSNAYVAKKKAAGGLWNGVPYVNEITEGQYEHLAIVNNPRYEESVILTPEEFKRYNEEKLAEIKKFTNSKGDKMSIIKTIFYKKSKVENAIDPELSVILPKSGKEKTVSQIINEADESEMNKKNGEETMANPEHKVKLHDGSMCNVGELIERHKALNDALEATKKDTKEEELPLEEKPVEVEGDKHNEESDDEGAKKKALQLAEHEEKEIEEAKKKNELAKKKADALRNAHLRFENEEPAVIELPADKVRRGKQLYGSGK
jgi:hypothetical protein